MDLMKSMSVSASGMRVQGMRMKMISENIANADSVTNADGTGPYRRQGMYLQPDNNRADGVTKVKLSAIRNDYTTPLKQIYDPTHEFADERGFVQMPNVDITLESADLREAARSYEANLSAIDSTKRMMQRTISILQ
ncbi:MAG: flagellar basal body rod protein FlgC [Magnetococcales bacterium]|nr:flagellar basal body rod protein FlgC [Magnetococcales bacterium]